MIVTFLFPTTPTALLVHSANPPAVPVKNKQTLIFLVSTKMAIFYCLNSRCEYWLSEITGPKTLVCKSDFVWRDTWSTTFCNLSCEVRQSLFIPWWLFNILFFVVKPVRLWYSQSVIFLDCDIFLRYELKRDWDRSSFLQETRQHPRPCSFILLIRLQCRSENKYSCRIWNGLQWFSQNLNKSARAKYWDYEVLLLIWSVLYWDDNLLLAFIVNIDSEICNSKNIGLQVWLCLTRYSIHHVLQFVLWS